jgi:hypothetical protein
VVLLWRRKGAIVTSLKSRTQKNTPNEILKTHHYRENRKIKTHQTNSLLAMISVSLHQPLSKPLKQIAFYHRAAL